MGILVGVQPSPPRVTLILTRDVDQAFCVYTEPLTCSVFLTNPTTSLSCHS